MLEKGIKIDLSKYKKKFIEKWYMNFSKV
jgi:hypothetical protein